MLNYMPNKTRMRYNPYLRTESEIINLLALEKEFAQYDMPKRIGKNYRTILRHLIDLKQDKLIRLNRTEKSQKKGKDKNIFELTEWGLLYALANADLWQEIDKVASNYGAKLPLIFGKWDFYIAKGLRKEIIMRLQAAILGLQMSLGRRWYRIVPMDRGQSLKIKLEKDIDKEKAKKAMVYMREIAPTFTNRVLGLDIFLYLDKNDVEAAHKEWRFIKIAIEDNDLHQYYDDAFNHQLEKNKSEYEGSLRALNWYKELKASKDL